ncbi:AAA family ATPase [Roseinatronobacter monicus]|uniref:ClpA/ClpB-like protein n=1 Tax=Roseinatronobacter monicus TaxID=393481 RepID=A0A543K4T5_9RHOB|nr:AAA family ATPase [Roseinatronobacter monicus]TQM90089.1 ClpA/ClpB-like protein [Roseinatronobacter monicus]
MPFLNDMLEDTERRRRDALALQAETLSSKDVVGAHLASGAINSRFRFDIDVIRQHLEHEIIGQDDALAGIIDMLSIVRADIADPRRPLYTSLLLGPTGVGKTEMVRVLAKAMHGDADALCRVDMNTLSQEHYAAAISGAPPGYVGSKEGRTILDQEKIEGSAGKPGIVLFDEFEKASAEVVLSLLNVFDNGILTVASGERVYSFRNAIIFMTSNLGTEHLRREAIRQTKPWATLLNAGKTRKQRLHTIAQDVLLESFPPEFVNRIDQIEVFNWIDHENVEVLIALEMEKLNRRLNKHDCLLEISQKLRDHIALNGFDRQFGARSLRRAVRRFVEVPFARFLLGSEAASTADVAGKSFTADLVAGEAVILRSDEAGKEYDEFSRR